jgi:hypothetical protein
MLSSWKNIDLGESLRLEKNIIIFWGNYIIQTSFSVKLFIKNGMKVAEIACWALANMLKIVDKKKWMEN